MPVVYPRFRSILAVTGAFLGFQFLLAIPYGIRKKLLSGTEDPLLSILDSVLLCAVFLLSYSIILRGFRKKSRLDPKAFSRRDTLLPLLSVGFALFLPGFLLLIGELDNLIAEWSPLPTFVSSTLGAMLTAPGPLMFVLLVLIPGFLEELMFRGYFLQGLKDSTSAGNAIIGTALIFGLIHLNPWQMVTAIPMGLLFGWISRKTGSILLPILGHSLNNRGFFKTQGVLKKPP